MNENLKLTSITEEDIDLKNLMKVSDAPRNETTPFPIINEEGVIKIKTGNKYLLVAKSKKENVIVNKETGEEKETMTLITEKVPFYDKEEFTKVFRNEISAFYNLSTCGNNVLNYVLSICQKDKDMIYIHMPDLMKSCGYKTKAAAYKGLGELLSRKIIALSVKMGWWYINPAFIFNGNRLALLKEYIYEPKRIPSKQLSLEPNTKFEETKLIEKNDNN